MRDDNARSIGDIIPDGPAISARYCVHVQETWYVSDLPKFRNGKQHGDFGYDARASMAIALSPYWQRRIRVIVRDCSTHDSIQFTPATDAAIARLGRYGQTKWKGVS